MKKNSSDFKFEVSHTVNNIPSIAHLFNTKDRSGIYLLSFENGEYYIGRTNNIVARYIAHRRNHKDIQTISFINVIERQQDDVERSLIHEYERLGYKLRNKSEASKPYGECDLDYLINLKKQNNWLSDNSYDYDQDRSHIKKIKFQQNQQYKKFSNNPIAPVIKNVLSAYIKDFILAPELTELSFWSLSCMPSSKSNYSDQDLVRVNMGRCEVLTLGNELKFIDDKEWGKDFFAAFHLARTPIEKINKHMDLEYFGLKAIPMNHQYRFAGQDQLSFLLNSPEDFYKAINTEPIRKAIKLFNLRCMKKRANMYSRYHCLELANEILKK